MNRKVYEDLDMHPYSNRELDEKFTNLANRAEEHHNDVMAELKEIKVQTTQHNGRMSNLEKWRTGLTYSTVAVWTVVIAIVIPLTVYAFNLAISKP